MFTSLLLYPTVYPDSFHCELWITNSTEIPLNSHQYMCHDGNIFSWCPCVAELKMPNCICVWPVTYFSFPVSTWNFEWIQFDTNWPYIYIQCTVVKSTTSILSLGSVLVSMKYRSWSKPGSGRVEINIILKFLIFTFEHSRFQKYCLQL